MANGTFKPQANPFLGTMQNLFKTGQQSFSEAVGTPQKKQMMAPDFLTQLKGRFQNAEQMSQLKSTIGDYGKLAAGEQGYEQMPEATPEATPALSPVVQNATPAAPAQANAPAISPYSYQNMAQDQRDMRIDKLLRTLGADMSLYEGESPRSKYEDILANFSTDGGLTQYGWHTNIYNRWGLPDDYYRDFLIPYLKENAPMGSWPYQTKKLINDIGAESGKIYDQNKAWMDMTRRSKGGGFMDEMMDQVTNYIPGLSEAKNVIAGLNNDSWTGLDKFINTASNLVAPYIESSGQAFSEDIAARTIPDNLKTYAPAVGAGIGTLVYPVLGTVAGHKIGSLAGGQYKDSPSKTALGTGTAALAAYLGGQLMPSTPVAGPEGMGGMAGELGTEAALTNAAPTLTELGTGAMSKDELIMAKLMQDAGIIPGRMAGTEGMLNPAQAAELGIMTPEQAANFGQLSNAWAMEGTPTNSPSRALEVLKNPAMRKMVSDILGQIQQGRGQQQEMPYYFQGIPYTEGAQSTAQQSPLSATDELTGGALTYKQMEQEPAEDKETAVLNSSPFMSASEKAKQKQKAAKMLVKLKAIMSEQ